MTSFQACSGVEQGSLVEVFAALANSDRFEIVNTLLQGHVSGRTGMAVTELARELGISRFAASHHLGILRAAGVVETGRHGNRSISVLHTERLMEIWDWIDRIDASMPTAAVPSSRTT